MGVEFILILKIEVELTYNPFLSIIFDRTTFDQIDTFSYIPIQSDSFTPFTDIVYTIIERKNII